VCLSQNEIGLEGDCSTKNITIALAETENPENVVYSGGARCNGNSFSFYDDLSKWDIENGEYALIVNGEKTNKTIKRQKNLFAVQTDFEESVVLGTENNPGESDYNSDARFLEAYASFQESLVDMQTWVGSTRYPVLVKSGIELAIDGIIAVSGRITDLVWSGENSVENSPNGY